MESFENSIRVSIDVVKNKTSSGLSWIRNKLNAVKAGYNTFQEESKQFFRFDLLFLLLICLFF